MLIFYDKVTTTVQISNFGPFHISLLALSAFNQQLLILQDTESNRKAMNRNWSNQKANPALKTKAGNK